jgi:tripeptidyl-peptidase-1
MWVLKGPSASRYTEGLTYPTPNIYYSLVLCRNAGSCAEFNPSEPVDLPLITRTTPTLPMTTSVSESSSDVVNPAHIETPSAYIDWLNYMLAQSSVPQTVTTSYADDEREYR